MWRRRLQAHGFDVAGLEVSIIIRYEDDLILFAVTGMMDLIE
jgi:hypothetical protein